MGRHQRRAPLSQRLPTMASSAGVSLTGRRMYATERRHHGRCKDRTAHMTCAAAAARPVGAGRASEWRCCSRCWCSSSPSTGSSATPSRTITTASISFSDIIYFTMISATTTGYGDIVPVTDRARLFDALVVTPIRIFFILILAGTAYTFVIKRTWNRWLMRMIQKNLRDHIIIAGYGVSNSKALEELLARGVDPRRIVVIDPSERGARAGQRMRGRGLARRCQPRRNPRRRRTSTGPRRCWSPPAATTARS